MKRFAVVGSPISHSLSPVLHQAAFNALGLDWTYQKHEVVRGALADFLDREPFDGLSVTMPLKDDAFALAIDHDEWARQTSVVNTLVRQGDRYFGANTDVLGFQSALDEAGLNSLGRVIIIGNGATARSAAVAVRGRSHELLVMARRAEMHGPHVDGFLEWGGSLESDLVISTVPADAAASLEGSSGVLFDVIYSPWPTALASKWQGGLISGLDLLIHQAAFQSALFVGSQVIGPSGFDIAQVRATMRAAVSKHLLSN